MRKDTLSRKILRESGRLAKEKFIRYLPAELIGTATTFASGALAARYFPGNELAIGYAAMMGENIGFFGTMITYQFLEDRAEHKKHGLEYTLRDVPITMFKIGAEFSVAEAIDSPIIRPLTTAAATRTVGPELGIALGKIVADVCFYLIAGTCHELRKRYWPEKKNSNEKPHYS